MPDNIELKWKWSLYFVQFYVQLISCIHDMMRANHRLPQIGYPLVKKHTRTRGKKCKKCRNLLEFSPELHDWLIAHEERDVSCG